jgi:phage terminase large subunit
MTARPWPEAALQAIRRWHFDPVAFAVENFEVTPDRWQADALIALAANDRVAMKACKGPGKSAVMAWAGWWLLATHPQANGIACSITGDNLQDGLWKELGVWLGRPKAKWLAKAFEKTSQAIYAREAKDTWRLSARSFAQDARDDQQANTLAGLHGPFVFELLDEVSDYPRGVLSAAEGIFNVEGQQARLMVAGNPTRSEGPLFEICTTRRGRWRIIEITGDPDDPQRSPRISLEHAREQIADFGRDDPWVMVNILGKFPPQSDDRLLGPDDISAAEARNVSEADCYYEPVIYGLDCARFGKDSNVLRRRWGPVAFRPHVYRGLDGPSLASRVAAQLLEDERTYGRRADALFIDVTGGTGASPYDHLCLLGFGDIAFPVEFASQADDARNANKRVEIWRRAAHWIKKTGCLPSGSGELGAQLMAPWIKFKLLNKRTCWVMQSKEELAEKGLASPDDADAFALTFTSETITSRDWHRPDMVAQHQAKVRVDYDPYADAGRP